MFDDEPMQPKTKVEYGTGRTILGGLVPLGGAVFPLLTLLGRERTEPWVLGTGLGFSAVVFVLWAYVVLVPPFRAHMRARRQATLSKPNSDALRSLLSAVMELLSLHYTLSPFYIWHRVSNDSASTIRMDIGYFESIRNWITHCVHIAEDRVQVNKEDAVGASLAVAACCRLAERARDDIQAHARKIRTDETELTPELRDWQLARETFNDRMRRMAELFEHINHENQARCVTHLPLLSPIDTFPSTRG